jgi:hypothetical protein
LFDASTSSFIYKKINDLLILYKRCVIIKYFRKV